MNTLEQYLREAIAQGSIDHALRASIGVDGVPRFYIHPAYASGRTLDFTVQGNALTFIAGVELAPSAVDVGGDRITGP